MNLSQHDARATPRFSPQLRADWPDTTFERDPDRMHPRAVAMAQAMREGKTCFRSIVAAGFTVAEIAEFRDEARALATSLSSRQVAPGADLLSELVAKASAAIDNQRPMPKGARETQALVVAWQAYCKARNAYVLDPWPSQRERCLALLSAYFRQTPAGPAVTSYVIDAVAQKLARVR